MGLFDILKGNAFTTAEKNKLAGIDPSKYVPIAQFEALQKQVAELLQAKPEQSNTIDTSVFLTAKDLPTIPSMDGYALTKDIPSIAGLATVKQLPNLVGYAKLTDIPKLPDMSVYALKKDIPDTVKYIENSNSTSKIKKIRLSIEDKATFKPDSNPSDNIAHTI